MKAGHNDPCLYGSGKKFKKCCISKDQSTVSSYQEIYDHEQESNIDTGEFAVGNPWSDCSIFMQRNLHSEKSHRFYVSG